MYYSTSQRNTVLSVPPAYAGRRLTAFLIISIFLITFPVTTFAEKVLLENSAEEYHQKAYEAHQKGHLEQALTYYSKALSLGLHDPSVYNDIGILYEQLGAGDRALEYYQEAIRVDQNYLPAYTNLGYLYLEKGDTEKAGIYLRKRLDQAPAADPWRDTIEEELLKVDPRYGKEHVEDDAKELDKQLAEELNTKAREKFNLQLVRSERHYQQGQIYLTEKKFKEATLEFTRALALTPNNPKILRAREEAVYKTRVEEIRKRANSAIEKLEEKDVKSSRKQFEDILTRFPSE